MSDRSNIYRDIFNGTNQKRWEEEQKQENMKEKNLDHMPDQKLHRKISLIKSAGRLIGYASLPVSLEAAAVILILCEVLGIVEELV
jgi:hypothetical protein